MIISGLTNLLSANMEAGLKHCLPMGYNEDPRARKIFVHIFARVLKQGTSFVTVSTGEESVSRLCEVSAYLHSGSVYRCTFSTQSHR